MPLLMNCLTSNLDKSYRQLQCRALEAATMVALAVGKESFRPYTQALLDVMIAYQKSELESDDMMIDYLAPSWVRMCQVLGNDFSPFVPLVLPPLLDDAAAEPDIAVIDAADPGAEDEYDPNEWEFATIKGRRLGIHTATLDSKCAAVENLAIYISTLQNDFAPYAEQTFNIILPLVHFTMHEGVQCASVEALASLIKVFHESNKKTNPPTLTAAVKSITAQSLNSMLKQLKDTDDAEVTVAIIDAMADICNVCDSEILPEGFLSQAFETINRLLTILLQHQGAHSKHAAQHEEEEEEDEEQRDEDDESVMYAITRLSAALFKYYRQVSLGPSETLLQFCLRSISSGKAGLALFKHASVCVLDDLVHWLGEGTLPIRDHISQSFAKALVDEDPDTRQAAAFGIGMCSEHAPSIYEGLCVETLPHLLGMIEHPDSKAPSVITVTDNAMSAVARICQSYSTDLSNVIPRWLHGLPVTHDEDEAPVVYKWLLELLQSGAVAVQGEQGIHILRSLIEPLIRECLTDPIRGQVKAAAAALQQQLPSQAAQAAVSTFTPEQLAKLSS